MSLPMGPDLSEADQDLILIALSAVENNFAKK
jgi:hypothetical protein